MEQHAINAIVVSITVVGCWLAIGWYGTEYIATKRKRRNK